MVSCYFLINGCEKEFANARKQFHQWDPLRVYASISKAKVAIFSLRFFGQEVGLLVPKNGEVKLVLKGHSKKNANHFQMSLEDGEYIWTDGKAKDFRSHFKKLAKKKSFEFYYYS